MKTLTQHDELLVKPYIDSKIQTLTNQVKDMNNVYGSKNLLPLTKRTGGTQSGVTFTVNDNGSITVNGTATSGIGMNETVNKIFLGIIPKGEYLISCKKDKTTVAQAYYTITNGVSNIPVEEDKVLSLDSDTTLNMWIYVSANVTYDNVTFYPMIRLASIEDDTYAPYAKTNRELTGYADNTEVNGAVNMLPNNATTQTVNGITFTVNDDGSVTANGTSTGYTPLVIAQHGQASFFDDFIGKPIKLSGCPSDGASNTYKLRFGYASGNYVDDVGEGVIITPTAGNSNTWYVEIGISGGVTVSNLTFKPMITVPSYNGDYVPYAMSNRELTVRTDNKFRRTRKDITNYLDNLVTAIAAQDLESYGYSIGDYFVGASGYKYHLADMDTYYGSYASYAVLNTHHIGIVVQTGATAQWNTSGSTSTGYSGSNLHTYLTGTVLNNIKSDMIALFGGTTGLEHLLSHQKLLTNNVSAWAWVTDQYISALSEVQVYSSRVWGIDGYQTGEANKPLQIFQKFRFNEVFGNIWFWLRDILSASNACLAHDSGTASIDAASYSGSVVGLILFH